MNDSGGWLLPGESIVWTGRPVRARVTLADAGLASYLAVALVVVAVTGARSLHGLPGTLEAGIVIVWATAMLQALGMLVRLLVIGPRQQLRTVYEVTNYRVIESRPRRGDVASVYLDQAEPPVVRRRNGTQDVVLGPSVGQPGSRGLAGLFRSRGLGPGAVAPVTRLLAVRDAEQACQVIADARRRMVEGGTDVPSCPAPSGAPVPGEIALASDELVLWAGRPSQIPWWFGGGDIYLTAFMFVWLAVITIVAVVAVRTGSAAFLVFLIPFGLAGGVYPAVGRLVHRRLLIGRSRYLLTSRSLITTWRPLRGGAPIVVRAPLDALLPPSVHATSVFSGLAHSDSRPRNGWKDLTWPATTMAPPALIGVADAKQIAQLIGTAQIRSRTPRQVA